MNAQPMSDAAQESDRKRRIRRNTLWLTALALMFYAGFIALSVMRAGT